MTISKILNSLEKSWERDDILLKIKNGLDADIIVNEFLSSNEIQITELNNLLKDLSSAEEEACDSCAI